MAARSVPERLAWAMQTMAIAPADHVLEIGCGRGIAASLVCQRLSGGRIVAIDRSLAMAKLAEQRNIDDVEAGKAVFLATPLDAADLTGERFDKVFAVNVNLFWVRSSVKELDLVRRVLKRNGAMYLFYEPPQPARAMAIAERVASFLTEQGFTTTTLTTTTNRARAVVCVVARRPGRAQTKPSAATSAPRDGRRTTARRAGPTL
jgi:ubiquinone/menaquinone biosynthesis C-methylase UbiE